MMSQHRQVARRASSTRGLGALMFGNRAGQKLASFVIRGEDAGR
jgi:hypothetical protein